MQIVQVDELPIQERLSGGRAGTWKKRTVLRGDPESLGNFSFVIYYHNGSFYSPRHHHNFDQFRYQIDGEADFGQNGKMTPGVLGYFPEGAYYGPTSGPAHTVAVLQFGGPSGSGYLSADRYAAAVATLKATGVFEDGVFHPDPGTQGKKKDSYEAVWEQVHGRHLAYPKPQYIAPVMMDSENCPWMPADAAPGVAEKSLGTFTNCRIVAARYQLAPGAELVARRRGIYMILSGSGSVQGTPLRALTTVSLEEGDTALFKAHQTTDILLMGMPSPAIMGAQAGAPKHDLAAD